jgi:hypothetical protein
LKVALLKLGGTEADLRCEIALILARRLIERAPLLEALFDAFEPQRRPDCGGSSVSRQPLFGAEVTLKEGKKRIGRWVVSVGATPLKD